MVGDFSVCLLRVMCDEGGLFSMPPPGSLLICFVFRLSVSGSLWAWRWFLVQCDVKLGFVVQRWATNWPNVARPCERAHTCGDRLIRSRANQSKVLFAPVVVRRPAPPRPVAPLRSAPPLSSFRRLESASNKSFVTILNTDGVLWTYFFITFGHTTLLFCLE